MFCNKPLVNLLVAHVAARGVKHVVVCPGSRNAPIVNDLDMLAAEGRLTLHGVTDERSVAFVALGMAQALGEPVAVCVTSGSALLGTLPAVSEAAFRHVPIIIISADRPPRRIGQLDGQTLPQQGALMPYCPTFQLSETDMGWSEHLLNEAFLYINKEDGRPVHLNVPLSLPLFTFVISTLPTVNSIGKVEFPVAPTVSGWLVGQISEASQPVLVVGQTNSAPWPAVEQLDRNNSLFVLSEYISGQRFSQRLGSVEAGQTPAGFQPDLVIHCGGNLVGRRLKTMLRQSRCRVIRVQTDETLPDTFDGLQTVVRCKPQDFMEKLAATLPPHEGVRSLREAFAALPKPEVPATCCEERVVALLEKQLEKLQVRLHVANSKSVRLVSRHYEGGRLRVFCNRGVNGIEGSLSTAAGSSLAGLEGTDVVIIGDLSFFYDANALWNTELGGNLRILLLNNGGGAIFSDLPGLEGSPARERYVMGRHTASARGICAAYDCQYVQLDKNADISAQLHDWLTRPSKRPVVLECLFYNHIYQ